MLPKFESYPLWVRFIRFLLRSWFFLYDIVAFIPKQIWSNPEDKLELSNRIKARQLDPDDPTSPWRSTEFEDLQERLFDDCPTLDKIWKRSVIVYPNNKCLGRREILAVEQETQANGKVFEKYELGGYKWQTYAEVAKRVDNVGSGLLAIGHKTAENLVIFSDTRPEWLITAVASLKYGFPVTTVYATLGDEAIAHAINQCEAETIVTSVDLISKLVNLLPHCRNVKRLVHFHSNVPGVEKGDWRESSWPAGFKVLSLEELERLGEAEGLTPQCEPKPEDLAFIMYTSGTTGVPKGVMITHRNLIAANAGQCRAIAKLNETDCYVAYLPLAHVLELSAELGCLTYGVSVGYASPFTLLDISSKVKKGCKGDLRVLKPTCMAVVPTICDRLYKGIVDKINASPPWLQALFHLMVQRKRDKLESGYNSPFLNRLIFKKSRGILGGKVRLMLCGGAPLSAETQRVMNICFCCPAMQGYGLTETCGAGTVGDVNDLTTGRVGAPLVCNDFRLREWKEGGYAPTNEPNPQGEILISGANVVDGYYKRSSEEDFVQMDGRRWLCTGDIGEFCSDGVLKIIDRKKDLLKLSHGEYVSLAKVETALLTCPLVDNICAYGSSLHSYLVALVVPNRKNLTELAESMHIDATDFDRICANPIVKKSLLGQLEKYGRQRKLDKFEIPVRIHLCTEVWLPSMGLLTEALKLKRRPIEQFYRQQLDELYKD